MLQRMKIYTPIEQNIEPKTARTKWLPLHLAHQHFSPKTQYHLPTTLHICLADSYIRTFLLKTYAIVPKIPHLQTLQILWPRMRSCSDSARFNTKIIWTARSVASKEFVSSVPKIFASPALKTLLCPIACSFSLNKIQLTTYTHQIYVNQIV